MVFNTAPVSQPPPFAEPALEEAMLWSHGDKLAALRRYMKRAGISLSEARDALAQRALSPEKKLLLDMRLSRHIDWLVSLLSRPAWPLKEHVLDTLDDMAQKVGWW